jgi:hypothetical protein
MPVWTDPYGTRWPQRVDALQVEFHQIRKAWKVLLAGRDASETLAKHYLRARKLIWPERYCHRWTELMYRSFCRHNFVCLIGSACVDGKTRILDPVTQSEVPIEELEKKRIRPTVMTLIGPVQAEIPFIKGTDEMVEIVLENGSAFRASNQHIVLTETGFERVSSLHCGQLLPSYSKCRSVSTSEHGLLVPSSSAAHYWQRVRDFQFDCPVYPRFCDEQLLQEPNICRGGFPSPSGAHKRRDPISTRKDGFDKPRERILLKCDGHPSTMDDWAPESKSGKSYLGPFVAHFQNYFSVPVTRRFLVNQILWKPKSALFQDFPYRLCR